MSERLMVPVDERCRRSDRAVEVLLQLDAERVRTTNSNSPRNCLEPGPQNGAAPSPRQTNIPIGPFSGGPVSPYRSFGKNRVIITTGAQARNIQAAVAVVGAGPAGLSIALALARAGIDTVIIESGGVRNESLATSLSSASKITPINHAPLEWATDRRLGGASWLWGGRCVDIDPIDFEPRRASKIPGWPITYQEATIEATAAATFLGIGKPQFETQLDCIGSDSLLYARLERWCADARLARRHATEIRTDPNVRVYTGLTCTGIVLKAGDRQAHGLHAKHHSGSDHFIVARHYVLAAGGIETARLLLVSTEASSDETMNAFRWLGRGYMGHFDGTLADVVLDRLSEEEIDYTLDETPCYVRRRLMLRPDVVRRNGSLNIAFSFGNPALADWRHRSGALSAAALALRTPLIGPMLQPGPIRDILLGQELTARDLPRHLFNM